MLTSYRNSHGENDQLTVLLMIILGRPPLPRLLNLRNDFPPLQVLVLRLGRHLPRHLFLLGRMKEDGRAVLRSPIGSLTVDRRRVVCPVEILYELAVADGIGRVGDADRFGVPG